MLLARVEGNLIATRRHSSFDGWRLLVCQPVASTGEPEGTPVVAIDPLGAALHQQVVVSSDVAAARLAVRDPQSPVRMLIIGIVDAPNQPASLPSAAATPTPYAAR
jgi:microcompartment protein CcmK/EutM